jgi:hypothetical protein
MNPEPRTIKFETGQPVTLALAYADGKPCQSRFSGDSLMYTTTEGDRFFTEPYFQDRLRAAQIAVGQPIEIEKRETWHGNKRVVSMEVRRAVEADVVKAPAPRVMEQQTPNPTPAPRAPQPPALPPVIAPVNGQGQNSADFLARCYHQAIDIALAATAYAETKGLRITPAFEDIRALAATICINESGRR